MISSTAPGPDTAHYPTVIAAELGLRAAQVAPTLALLTGGATVPFIARYRKEATLGLDEVQIRAVEEALERRRDCDARRTTVLASLVEQGVLTPELRGKLLAATERSVIEDLYLPYRPKRRTRAGVAKERGCGPLAEAILAQGDAAALAAANALAERVASACAELDGAKAAWAGACDIVAEQVAERAEVRQLARKMLTEQGVLHSQVVADKAEASSKFEQYYAFEAPIGNLAGHQILAVRRGEKEGFLRLKLRLDTSALEAATLQAAGYLPQSPFAATFQRAVADGVVRLLLPGVETDVRLALRVRAEREAVDVFGGNLRHLLLAAPLGAQPVLGIDPGLRTGCKCAAVDATGAFVAEATIYLHRGEGAKTQAKDALLALVRATKPAFVAVGNGTGGRETEAFVREALRGSGDAELAALQVVAVSEAGASVYSASTLAREELPKLDVTVRGAVSIARRLQDPLAELVKIDPKAIGVGQYQHDVHPPLLARKLDEVVESSVNAVGVALNTASAPLLARVAGVGPALAQRIVAHRNAHGPFARRQALLEVPGLGARTFEQAAGFLRIVGGEQPLDASAVHPERYDVVAAMAADVEADVGALVGNAELTRALKLSRYVTDAVGEPTLRDIVAELARPGRDPRQDFAAVAFSEHVNALEDLHPQMELMGVVTNVTAFGAFVDVGAHQDGLVHISQLADRFVAHPSEVVRVGQQLKVRVLEVDLVRRRVALSARRDAPRAPNQAGVGGPDRASQADGRGAAGARKGPAGADNAPRRPRSGETNRPRAGARVGAGPDFGHNPFAKLRPI